MKGYGWLCVCLGRSFEPTTHGDRPNASAHCFSYTVMLKPVSHFYLLPSHVVSPTATFIPSAHQQTQFQGFRLSPRRFLYILTFLVKLFLLSLTVSIKSALNPPRPLSLFIPILVWGSSPFAFNFISPIYWQPQAVVIFLGPLHVHICLHQFPSQITEPPADTSPLSLCIQLNLRPSTSPDLIPFGPSPLPPISQRWRWNSRSIMCFFPPIFHRKTIRTLNMRPS